MFHDVCFVHFRASTFFNLAKSFAHAENAKNEIEKFASKHKRSNQKQATFHFVRLERRSTNSTATTMTQALQLLAFLSLLSVTSAWILPSPSSPSTALSMVATKKKKLNIGRNYEPKWKKQATLAEKLAQEGAVIRDPKDVGLVGTVPVVFKQGNVTKTTMAIVGQPLSEVATQAGQFIKYGCGKGECGTCESLCNGQWIRPCMETVPNTGEEIVITVKEVKNKSKSSGKFYSVRSFLFGFYNNVLGMVGFVRTRKYAKKNWQERQEYEENLKKLVAEKKAARAAAAENGQGGLKP